MLLAGLEGGGYIFFCEGVAVAAGPLHQVMTPPPENAPSPRITIGPYAHAYYRILGAWFLMIDVPLYVNLYKRWLWAFMFLEGGGTYCFARAWLLLRGLFIRL